MEIFVLLFNQIEKKLKKWNSQQSNETIDVPIDETIDETIGIRN